MEGKYSNTTIFQTNYLNDWENLIEKPTVIFLFTHEQNMIVMKPKYFIFNILILLILLLSLIPIVNSFDLFYLLVHLPITFIYTIIIEFVVIYLFLRNHGIEQFHAARLI